MDEGVRLNIGRHVEGADWECDDGRIVLRDKFVLGKPFDVKEQVRWEGVEESVALAGVEVFLGAKPVVFREDRGERNLSILLDLQFIDKIYPYDIPVV